MLAAPWAEPVRESQEVFLVDLVENRDHCLLDDLVLQGRDSQWTSPSIGFGYVGSLGGLSPIGSAMDPILEITQPLLQSLFVLLPGHPIDAGRCATLEAAVALPEQIGGDVVQ